MPIQALTHFGTIETSHLLLGKLGIDLSPSTLTTIYHRRTTISELPHVFAAIGWATLKS